MGKGVREGCPVRLSDSGKFWGPKVNSDNLFSRLWFSPTSLASLTVDTIRCCFETGSHCVAQASLSSGSSYLCIPMCAPLHPAGKIILTERKESPIFWLLLAPQAIMNSSFLRAWGGDHILAQSMIALPLVRKDCSRVHKETHGEGLNLGRCYCLLCVHVALPL